MKYNAIVVDDELNMRKDLERILAVNCPYISICGLASPASEAPGILDTSKVDFAFLNITTPGTVDLFFHHSFPDRNLGVIFITRHKDEILLTLKANAVDYLIKPFNPVDIKEVVSKAIQYYELRQINPEANRIYRESLANLQHQLQSANSMVEKITVPDQFGYRLVKVSDLIFLQADSNYTILHISDMNVIVSNQLLGEFERILANSNFFRINKTTIINMNYVNASSGEDEKTAVLTTGEKLIILRKRLIEFREAMLRYPK
jgi:two-component system LytT family response regulator